MPGYSPLLPLQTDPDDGIALTKTYQEVARQNFKMLVLTIPGEKVMDPDFGVGIKKFLFENAGIELNSSLITRVREQTKKYLPYIEIINIDIGDPERSPLNTDRNILSVKINYFVKPLDLQDVLELLFDF